jgi:hypothetical protein
MWMATSASKAAAAAPGVAQFAQQREAMAGKVHRGHHWPLQVGKPLQASTA